MTCLPWLDTLTTGLPQPFLLLRKLERKGFDIIFSWVPGHVGILGNEQAYTAARSMSDHMQRPVCYQDLKNFSTELYPLCMARDLGSTDPQQIA
ncbi:hypothetical protein TNCV_873111 [Trichonephila clavipes]|nr:hypothetical protein TNCV_873111 [Trichonephila clavipes]